MIAKVEEFETVDTSQKLEDRKMKNNKNLKDKKIRGDPGQVAQVVRQLSWHAKVVGSIPSQGTYKSQPVSA